MFFTQLDELCIRSFNARSFTKFGFNLLKIAKAQSCHLLGTFDRISFLFHEMITCQSIYVVLIGFSFLSLIDYMPINFLFCYIRDSNIHALIDIPMSFTSRATVEGRSIVIKKRDDQLSFINYMSINYLAKFKQKYIYIYISC